MCEVLLGLWIGHLQRTNSYPRKKFGDSWLTRGVLPDLVTKFDRQRREEGELSERFSWEIQAR